MLKQINIALAFKSNKYNTSVNKLYAKHIVHTNERLNIHISVI